MMTVGAEITIRLITSVVLDLQRHTRILNTIRLQYLRTIQLVFDSGTLTSGSNKIMMIWGIVDYRDHRLLPELVPESRSKMVF